MKSPRASRIIAVFIAALVISGLGAGAAAAAACPTPSKGPNDLPSGFSPYLGFSMHIEDAPYEFTGFDGGPLYSTEVRPGQTLVVDGIFNNCDFPGVVVWSSVSAAITDERGRPAAGGQVTLEPGAQGDLGQPALSDTGVLAWAGRSAPRASTAWLRLACASSARAGTAWRCGGPAWTVPASRPHLLLRTTRS